MSDHCVDVDCDAGRRMGCATFCCRLVIRLTEEESKDFGGARTIEKAEDGLCIYKDRDNHLCKIWERRPAVCRGYTCNGDDFLQVVVREGFTSLKDLAMSRLFVPKECYVQVPHAPNGTTPVDDTQ